MLVLSRKQGEAVVVGEGPDAVTVILVDIDRNKVRLGFRGPAHVPVDRQEVRDEKVMAAYAASKGATP